MNIHGQHASAASDRLGRSERRAAVEAAPDGRGRVVLSAPGIRCGGCIASIERALDACTGVVAARANLTLRRITVTLENADTDPLPVLDALDALGYPAEPIDASAAGGAEDHAGPGLLKAVAVAGFGAMNIMLLSVAVWSGADGAMREVFHLVSALIAVPVVAYAVSPSSDPPLQRSRASG